MTPITLINLDGITYAKLENGCLVPESLVAERAVITTSNQIWPSLLDLATVKQEQVVVITLDGHNQVIKRHIVTVGIANASLIHPREVFKPAIMDSAVSIIVAHNHPSGNLQPSEVDIRATRKLAGAAKLLGIPLLDHLIFAASGHKSIRESNPKLWDVE